MSQDALAESLPVFRYSVTRTFTISDFDEYGCAAVDFFIPFGKHKGMHAIYVETALLKLVRRSAIHITRRSTAPT